MVHVIPGRLSILRIPVRTLFDGLGQGCIAVAMSHDAQFVATVSMAVPQVHLHHRPLHTRMNIMCMCYMCCVQVVCVWDWTSGSDDPLCKTTLNTDFRQQVSRGTLHSPKRLVVT